MRFSSSTTKRLMLAATVAVFVLLPSITSAVSWIPIVPCGQSDTDLCTPCDLFQTGKNVIDLILFGITGPIAAFMVVLAGGMMLLGGGNPTLFGQGKTYLTRTLIGVAIILVSWTATNFLIKGLGGGEQGEPWYKFSCPGGLANISKIDTEFATAPAGLPTPGPAGAPPGGIGKRCPDSNLPLCGTAEELGATCAKCNNIRSRLGSDIFTKYARGVATAGLLESIMLNESSCGRKLESGAGAYGPMQLLPSTANMYKEQCGIFVQNKDGTKTAPDIDAGWLLSEANWDASVCIASAYLNSLTGTCGSDPRHLAANYNGREACRDSISCQGMTNTCGGGALKRWECVWENRQHTVCNADRSGGGYRETRGYAPKVAACASKL